MNKIRIGKDIRINWEITASDEHVILSQDNLTLEITTPSKCIAILPFTFNNNTITATFYGIDQTQIGNYWLTVWYNRNQIGQSALDKVLAFQLVRSTEEETDNHDSIAYAEVNLSGTIEINNGGVNLEYYTEDTSIGQAKIDNGYSSLVFGRDDDGYIYFNAVHTQITDGFENGMVVGTQSIGGVPCGVQVTTDENKKFLYNNNEVATKNDIEGFATSAQLTAHTTNNNIHVSAQDKANWNGKQDALDYEFESMTQAQYDALVTKDNNTLYFITEE